MNGLLIKLDSPNFKFDITAPVSANIKQRLISNLADTINVKGSLQFTDDDKKMVYIIPYELYKECIFTFEEV